LLTVFAPKKGYTKRSLYAKILCARNQERVFTPGVKTGGEGLELEQDKKDRCIRVNTRQLFHTAAQRQKLWFVLRKTGAQ